jgi:hypothetical protein
VVALLFKTPFAEASTYSKVKKPGASISSKDIALSASVGVQEISGKSKSSWLLGNSVSK